jgi:copper(I)-binding protein
MKKSLAFLFSVAMAMPACAAGLADQINVVDPYVRMSPPGSKTTIAFMLLRNSGDKEVKLVKANSTVAGVTELHNHINDNGVMRMRQVKEITIPAKGEARLQPSGYHVMLIDVKAPLKEGEHVVINLGFVDGSSKDVHAPVTKSNIGMPAPMDHSKMKH